MSPNATTTQAALMHRLKQSIKPLVPTWLRTLYHVRAARQHDARYREQSPHEVFSHIYHSGIWGAAADEPGYFSGTGSHEPLIVNTYVDAVLSCLRELPARPDVVDLGCGDFHIGSRIRPACGRYVACDVVEPLIAANRDRFGQLEVEFRCLDIARDDLPAGDVVFLRQVLQHLDNGRIASVLAKLERYKVLILTEHLPPAPDFPPNADKLLGASTRLARIVPSGVVLTAPPFNMKPVHTRVLCEVHEGGGVIQTIAYTLH
jgi:SAM-dependent methyltransferase